MAKGQELQEPHLELRLEFSCWFDGCLHIDLNFPQVIFFGDEKYFILNQAPNPKNTGNWSEENPNLILNVKNQGAKKAFCFVVMVDGRVLPPIWLDKDPITKKVSMNGPRYKKELQENVFSHFTQKEIDEKEYWWMQGISFQ